MVEYVSKTERQNLENVKIQRKKWKLVVSMPKNQLFKGKKEQITQIVLPKRSINAKKPLLFAATIMYVHWLLFAHKIKFQ